MKLEFKNQELQQSEFFELMANAYYVLQDRRFEMKLV